MLEIFGTPKPIEVVGNLDDVVNNKQQVAAVVQSMPAPKEDKTDAKE